VSARQAGRLADLRAHPGLDPFPPQVAYLSLGSWFDNRQEKQDQENLARLGRVSSVSADKWVPSRRAPHAWRAHLLAWSIVAACTHAREQAPCGPATPSSTYPLHAPAHTRSMPLPVHRRKQEDQAKQRVRAKREKKGFGEF